MVTRRAHKGFGHIYKDFHTSVCKKSSFGIVKWSLKSYLECSCRVSSCQDEIESSCKRSESSSSERRSRSSD
jgi:hypothetical protein